MDPWLLQLLENKTGGFRAARWNRCRHCNEIVLTGINDDQCAGTITADPTPLTAAQELECLLAGRDTVSATPHGRTYDLHRRDDDLISNHPAGGGTTFGTVIPAHQCGNRYPGFFQRPNRNTWPTTPQF